MKSRRVFEDFHVNKSNDLMAAFDNMIYDTACMLDDMNAYQVNVNKNKEKKYVSGGYKAMMNRYEDNLVNEIESMLSPSSSITVENSMYKYNTNSTESSVLPDIDSYGRYDYRKHCNTLSNNSKYNKNIVNNKRKYQFQLQQPQRNKQPYVSRFNTQNNHMSSSNNSKFIHASKYVLNNKNNNKPVIPFNHYGNANTNRNKYHKLSVNRLSKSPTKY